MHVYRTFVSSNAVITDSKCFRFVAVVCPISSSAFPYFENPRGRICLERSRDAKDSNFFVLIAYYVGKQKTKSTGIVPDIK